MPLTRAGERAKIRSFLKSIQEKKLEPKARICGIDGDGAILHVELKTEDGETVAGVYELIGWTKPPRDVKAKAELELWVPPKTTHPVT